MRSIIKNSGVVAAIAVAASIVAGCGSTDSTASADDGDIRVVAAFYPLQWSAERIGGSGVSVTNITPAGAEPHDLELAPRDLDTLRDADVILYFGGFQPALEDALSTLPDSVTAVDLLDDEALDLREGADEDGETSLDPHVWLDPVRFAQVNEGIAAALEDVGARDTTAGLESTLSGLQTLTDAFEARLATCERREVFTAHDAFAYLGDRFDLDMRPISGISPEAEPKPRDLERVADDAKAAGATTIFFETLVSPDVSEAVAREAGAETAVLDPLEGISKDAASEGADYLSVMGDNLNALTKGLGCTTGA